MRIHIFDDSKTTITFILPCIQLTLRHYLLSGGRRAIIIRHFGYLLCFYYITPYIISIRVLIRRRDECVITN